MSAPHSVFSLFLQRYQNIYRYSSAAYSFEIACLLDSRGSTHFDVNWLVSAFQLPKKNAFTTFWQSSKPSSPSSNEDEDRTFMTTLKTFYDDVQHFLPQPQPIHALSPVLHLSVCPQRSTLPVTLSLEMSVSDLLPTRWMRKYDMHARQRLVFAICGTWLYQIEMLSRHSEAAVSLTTIYTDQWSMWIFGLDVSLYSLSNR